MPSMTISGLASGLDTDNIIKQLIDIERRPVIRLQERKNDLQLKKDAWRDVNTRLLSLKSAMSGLRLTSTYTARTVTSGDEEAVTATAGSSASPTSYKVGVIQLAQAHKIASDTATVLSAYQTLANDEFSSDPDANIESKSASLVLDAAGGGRIYIPNTETSGNMISTNQTFADPVERLQLTVTEDTPVNTDIVYKYSTQNPATAGDASWQTITPGVEVVLNEPTTQVKFMAQFTNTSGVAIATLYNYTLEGKEATEAAGASTDLNRSGTFDISGLVDGSPATVNITVVATDSLNDIRDKINNAEVGVLAQVVDNRLVLTSETTGAEGAIGLTDGPEGVLSQLGILDSGSVKNELRAAQDAVFTIDGLEITRSANTVSDAIEGVSFTLSGETDDGDGTITAVEEVNITISRDTAKIKTAIEAFVEQYNSVMDFVGTKLAKEGTLNGETTLMIIQNRLRDMVNGNISEGTYTTLTDIGISTGAVSTTLSFNRSGKLTIDDGKLSAALAADPDAVKSIFFKSTNEASGATVSASSSHTSGNYPASSLTNGVTSSDSWGSNEGWQDNTPGDFNNEYVSINLGASKKIDRVTVYTLDSDTYPAATYGVSDYEIQAWDGSEYSTVASITANTEGVRTSYLTELTTTSLRIKINGSNDDQYSRLVEVEAYYDSGLAEDLYSYLDTLTQSGTGVVPGRQDGLDRTMKDMENQITSLETRLDGIEERLYRRFTAMEQALGSLKSQGDWLAGQIASLPGFVDNS